MAYSPSSVSLVPSSQVYAYPGIFTAGMAAPSPWAKVTGAVPVDVTAELIPKNPKSSFETET